MCDKGALLGSFVIILIVYVVGMIGFAIGICSWFVHIWHNGKWRVRFESLNESGFGVISDLIRSWDYKPFVDAIVTSAATCPATHPEDLVWDMWPGTVGHCDCLQREEDRSYFLSIYCERGDGDKNEGEHESEDCHERHGLAPIIQNRFGGFRYCGRRSTQSFRDMVRPEMKSDGIYQCPTSYEPCNPEFFGRPNGYQYVVCYKSGENLKQSVCPITDIKFDEQSKDPTATYMPENSLSTSKSKSLFLSTDFMQHGIE